jgi:hypothetical protein
MKIPKITKKDVDPSVVKREQSLNDRSPRFMSPTVSSSKQGATKSETEKHRMATFASIPTVKMSRTNWMTTAAKRVGLNRTSEETSQPRKDESKTEATTYQDEVSRLSPRSFDLSLTPCAASTDVANRLIARNRTQPSSAQHNPSDAKASPESSNGPGYENQFIRRISIFD